MMLRIKSTQCPASKKHQLLQQHHQQMNHICRQQPSSSPLMLLLRFLLIAIISCCHQNQFTTVAATNPSTTATNSSYGTIICRLVLDDLSYEPTYESATTSTAAANITRNDINNPDEFYACQPVIVVSDDDNRKTLRQLSHTYIFDDYVIPEDIKTAVNNRGHYSYIYVSVSNILLDKTTAKAVPVDSNASVTFEILDSEQFLSPKQKADNRIMLDGDDNSNFALQGQVKVLTVMVIRIVAKDSKPTNSIEELYDLTFSLESERSLRSQMLACSVGQLYLQPALSIGVIDVRVDVNAKDLKNRNDGNQLGRYVLLNAAYDNAPQVLRDIARSQQEMSVSGNTSIISSKSSTNLIDPDTIKDIRSVSDLVMMIVPPIPADSNWAAFGTVNGAASVYNDVWGSYLGATMHEVGHNLGLYHSNVDGIEYGDTTGYMGSAPKKEHFPAKCYNAQNHNSLQWFKDRSLALYSSDFTPQLINVATFVDYDKLPGPMYSVIVSIDDVYFMQYNRAKLHNNETSEYPDTLVIVQNEFKGTDRVAELHATEDYDDSSVYKMEATIPDASDLFVVVCKEYKSTKDIELTYVDYLVISIGTRKDEAKKFCWETKTPTAAPTTLTPSANPTPAPTTASPTMPDRSAITIPPSTNAPSVTLISTLPPSDFVPTQPALTPFPTISSTTTTNGPIIVGNQHTLSPTIVIIDGTGDHNSTGGGFVALEQQNDAGPDRSTLLIILSVLILIMLGCILFICVYRRQQRSKKKKRELFVMSEAMPARGFFRRGDTTGTAFSDIENNEPKGMVGDENSTVNSSSAATSAESSLSSKVPNADPLEVATSMLSMICTTDYSSEPVPSSSPSSPTKWTSYLLSAANDILDPKPKVLESDREQNRCEKQPTVQVADTAIQLETQQKSSAEESNHAQYVADTFGAILASSLLPSNLHLGILSSSDNKAGTVDNSSSSFINGTDDQRISEQLGSNEVLHNDEVQSLERQRSPSPELQQSDVVSGVDRKKPAWYRLRRAASLDSVISVLDPVGGGVCEATKAVPLQERRDDMSCQKEEIKNSSLSVQLQRNANDDNGDDDIDAPSDEKDRVLAMLTLTASGVLSDTSEEETNQNVLKNEIASKWTSMLRGKIDSERRRDGCLRGHAGSSIRYGDNEDGD